MFAHKLHWFPVSVSIGMAFSRETSGLIAGNFLDSADIACYAAKYRARNQLFVYSAADITMTEPTNELIWLRRLRHALDNDQFQLFAQPLSNLKRNGRITHFEILLRLNDEDGVEISPRQIIQAAERYGLMRDLDEWVISNALQSISELYGYDDIGFSINLSGHLATDPSLTEFIQNQYQTHRIDPGRLSFEITEIAAISNNSVAVEFIKSIQSLGSKVALDDFGSALSSLDHLNNLPVDILKIDGQLVNDLVTSSVDRARVKAIQDFADSTNLVTVAKFVESKAIVKVIEEMGVDFAQGYHIKTPLPLVEALQITNDPRQHSGLKFA